MDATDKKILNLIQGEFPVESEPFRIIAERMGIAEEDVLSRLQRLKDEGVIRRIGAVFEPGKLGFVSTLCAARVPEEKLADFVKTVNAYTGVTHNYRRNHAYNVWFTFIAPGEEALERSLKEIREKTGITDILSMRAVRTYKINARFDV